MEFVELYGTWLFVIMKNHISEYLFCRLTNVYMLFGQILLEILNITSISISS